MVLAKQAERRLLFEKLEVASFGQRLGAAINLELTVKALDVVADGVDADDQFVGDLLVRQPTSHQLENFALPLRERLREGDRRFLPRRSLRFGCCLDSQGEGSQQTASIFAGLSCEQWCQCGACLDEDTNVAFRFGQHQRPLQVRLCHRFLSQREVGPRP